jgi:CDP-glucose 4,6-dehydratase
VGRGQGALENLVTPVFANRYQGKRVFITGHTGFKGSWLAEWLLMLGAQVTGFSLDDRESPDHFTQLGLAQRMNHLVGDVRDADGLRRALHTTRPDIVFHLAAQSLVRRSYREPAQTMETNIMGTVNLLEALRDFGHPAACVIVTSDKCYENREVLTGYREDDPLGGRDPYSASKGAAEIVAHSYRRSFFSSTDSAVRMATARAGNVIGGGDWSEDRIVPDCIRNLMSGKPIGVRNPAATRPWQHVLEPLSAYLWLGALLSGTHERPGDSTASAVSTAFNFGPPVEANRSVADLVGELLKHWPGQWQSLAQDDGPYEAGRLGLACDKAFHLLDWRPVWSFEQNVEATAQWYRVVAADENAAPEQTRGDISSYVADARRMGLRWALAT